MSRAERLLSLIQLLRRHRHPVSGQALAAELGIFAIWTRSKQLDPLFLYLSKAATTDRPLELAGFDCQFTARASNELLIPELQERILAGDPPRIREARMGTALHAWRDELPRAARAIAVAAAVTSGGTAAVAGYVVDTGTPTGQPTAP